MNKKNERNTRDRAYRIWQGEERPAGKDKEHFNPRYFFGRHPSIAAHRSGNVASKEIEEEAEMTEGRHNLNCE